jgi:small subunit ribosomal protein S11
MGKKRVVKPEREELLKERERIEDRVTKKGGVEIKEKIERGRIYIKSSYNNTMITLTDNRGDVIFWTSAGQIGFKGTKKGTPFAASKVAEVISDRINKLGLRETSVFVKGVGPGRESALRSLAHRGVNITSIKDLTPIPHNGCRSSKVRRV